VRRPGVEAFKRSRRRPACYRENDLEGSVNSLNMLAIAGAVLFHVGTSPAEPPGVLSEGGVSGLVFDAVSGQPVEGAQVILHQARLGTRTSPKGEFRIMNRPGSDWTGEIEVRHPCFHTVRIELARDNLDDPLVVGLPFNQPRGPDRTEIPVLCAAYGPTVIR